MTSLEKALRDFAQFAVKLKGDEKSEAQTFLFHLLEAFGHDPNTLPEGATFEYRVRFVGGASAEERDERDGRDESSGPFTPALSQGERGNRRQSSRGSVSGGGSSPGDRT